MNQTDKNIALAKECGLPLPVLQAYSNELDEYTSRVCAAAERKLAAQQAALFTVRAILSDEDDFVKDTNATARKHIQKHFANQHEELNTLLAQAREEGRKEAVPEGWQVVPIEPTLEMLSEMNSSGWIKGNYKRVLSAAPKPEGDKE